MIIFFFVLFLFQVARIRFAKRGDPGSSAGFPQKADECAVHDAICVIDVFTNTKPEKSSNTQLFFNVL